MAYTIKKMGDHRERRNYAKVENAIELENLLEIQKKSYKWFIEFGIREVFDDIFPVESFAGNLSLEFGDYYFEEPRYSIKECKERYATYAAPLKVAARLFNQETGEVKEQEIYLGDMPIMSETGTFIINGAERVIVSQLVRSPSVYYVHEIDKNERSVIAAQVIPTRGTWLEYEMDARDVLYVRIDRTRKVPITTLLRAIGLSTDEDIISLFGEDEYLLRTIDKDTNKNTDEALIDIHAKLRPGEPSTLESAKNQLITRFFDSFRYDLARVGRYKFNKKLDVCDRLLDCVLAEDIKIKNKVIYPAGTLITKEILKELKPLFADGYGVKEAPINQELDTYNKVQVIKVYSKKNSNKIVNIIGNDRTCDVKRLTILDIYASISYYLNLLEGIGNFDEIDHLSNRRVRQVGELLQNQFRVGMTRIERVIRDRMSTQEIDEVTPKSLINIRPLTAAIKEFFGSSQLSQFMDQTNPLAELGNKRRLSSLGPGGLSRDRAGMEVRDVNPSHYGRLCPIESPEGQNIGLITSIASFAKVNEYGFIMTPYRRVVNCKLTDEVEYMTADEEMDYYIAEAIVKVNENNEIIEDRVPVRYRGDNLIVKKEQVDYIDVSPQQVVSITTGCIPFLEHDDGKRALMGANMQRQAIPLLKSEAPLIATGVEAVAARDSGAVVVAKEAGIVDYVDARKIVVKRSNGTTDTYYLNGFEKSNNGTCYLQKPIVKKGDKVKKDMVIADGPSTELGEMAIGKNITVAFMNFDGYNFEDAVILNERLVKDDVYTSIHIEDYQIECRDTKLGPEEFTRDIPNVGEEARKNLDENGIVRIGTEVKDDDILVGKVTPKGMAELTAEEKLLHAIFGEKTREVRDTSLRVPHGGGGIVCDVKVFTKEDCDELPAGVSKIVRVYVAQKRKITVGDKMAGRHGNKGVISLVLPEEDMPYMADGTPVDVLLSPLGVPSRMNIGQILEMHLGFAAEKLNIHVLSPVFAGATREEILDALKEAGLPEDGKMILYDGRTGEPFDHPISVGVIYMMKLHHMVDDKLHARSTGPYSLVTQQPLGGKAQFGGQRFGEMEVWALYAYGTANILQEMLTIKSDDVLGRVKVYEALVKGQPIPLSGIPESFRVLIKEFQALGLDITVLTQDGKFIEIRELEESEKDGFLTTEEFEKSIDVNLLNEEKKEEDSEPSDLDVEAEDYENSIDDILDETEDYEPGPSDGVFEEGDEE